MKKIITILAVALTFSFQSSFAQSDPMFYEVISNPEKTFDFTFGVTTPSLQFVSGDSPYSVMKMVVINNSREPLEWTKDEKILVILKDGRALISYTTVSETGEYANEYTVEPGTSHIQQVCLKGAQFQAKDIASMYLIFSGTRVFKMLYDDGKKK